MAILDKAAAPMATLVGSVRVPDDAHGWRLDKTLGLLLSETDWGLRARRRLCDRGLVLVGRRTGTPGTKVRAGQEITFLPDPEANTVARKDEKTWLDNASETKQDETKREPEGAAANRPYPVFCDNELIALFKPAGLHTVSLAGSQAPSLEAKLAALLEEAHLGISERPRLLNRLDAPTSGLVLAALAREGELRWRRAERLGHADKFYLAIIEGHPLYDFSVCRRLDTDNRNRTRVRHTDDPDPLRHTDVTLLHAFTLAEAPGLVESAGCSGGCFERGDGVEEDVPLMLAGCRIRKGARHQIRAHLAAAGHPLFGDVLYGGALFPAEQAVRFFLHHGQVSLPGFTASCPAPWLDLLPEEAHALNWPQTSAGESEE